jgi:O-methyltransferase
MRPQALDAAAVADGRARPRNAETMIGLRRLDNLQACILDVLDQQVPGDIVETGVWRGGAMIFARAVLEAYGDTERLVWCADSFQGLPPPDASSYPADTGDGHYRIPFLAVTADEVRANFARYGLLDARVRFLEGWFRDTLPGAPIARISVLRLDGDMYESTIQALDALYPKLSPGGYVIVDDYGWQPCGQAVEDFRRQNDITDTIVKVDESCSYWQRT